MLQENRVLYPDPTLTLTERESPPKGHRTLPCIPFKADTVTKVKHKNTLLAPIHSDKKLIYFNDISE